MTYVVNEACIKCKYMDCVEVCPVDCFYEGENMLVIHPDECIDCGVCEPECPAEAIVPDSEPAAEKWVEINRQYASTWPNITRKGPPPEDADAWKGVPDKFEKEFNPNPSAETSQKQGKKTQAKERVATAAWLPLWYLRPFCANCNKRYADRVPVPVTWVRVSQPVGGEGNRAWPECGPVCLMVPGGGSHGGYCERRQARGGEARLRLG